MPLRVLSTTSSPGWVRATSISVSPSSRLMPMMPPCLRPAVLRQRRLLHQAAARRHQQVARRRRSWRTGMTLVIFSSGLSDSTLAIARPGAGPAHLRDVVDLQPVQLAAVGEAEQVGVRRGDEEVLDEVVLARRAAGDALAAAVLRAVGVQRQPLDVAVVADRDGVGLLGDQVLACRRRPPSSVISVRAVVAVLVAQLAAGRSG